MPVTISSGSDHTPGEGITISTGNGSITTSGGGATEGYNDPIEAELAQQAALGGSGGILGGGFDFGDGGSDQPSLADLQAATAVNTAIRQRLGTGSVPVEYIDLTQRAGLMPDFGSDGGLLGTLSRFSLPMNIGRMISQSASKGLLSGLEKGYLPQYNAIGQIVATYNPKTGQYGAGSVVGRIDPNDPRNEPVPTAMSSDDSEPYMAPVAASSAIEEDEEESMIRDGLVYPEGGFFPKTGRFVRYGLLDQPPTTYGGLLADIDPASFEAMNRAFRRPTYADIYQDPYDLTGYTLLDE